MAWPPGVAPTSVLAFAVIEMALLLAIFKCGRGKAPWENGIKSVASQKIVQDKVCFASWFVSHEMMNLSMYQCIQFAQFLDLIRAISLLQIIANMD